MATEEEIEYLLKQQVELNAFASDHLIRWIERKLEAAGVTKILPDDETLADAYRRMRRQAVVQERIDELLKDFDDDDVEVPDDLRAKMKSATPSALTSGGTPLSTTSPVRRTGSLMMMRTRP